MVESVTCHEGSASASTTCSLPTSCLLTAASSPPAVTRIKTSSGRSVAAAATSVSSRRSPSACHEIGEHGTVIAGPVFYDLADTEAVFRWYRELLPALPEELSGWIGILVIAPGPPFPEELWERKVCGIVWCYTGASRQG